MVRYTVRVRHRANFYGHFGDSLLHVSIFAR